MNNDDRTRRGADGPFHFLYCTDHVDTGDHYLGRHSMETSTTAIKALVTG